MFEFIRTYQLNIMLFLGAVCTTMTIMLFLTKFLTKRRKWILIIMEIIAALLIFFDRFTYIYSGDQTTTGFIMTRLSNFMVFFLTSAIVFSFNYYLRDLIVNEGKQIVIPRSLSFTGLLSAMGMLGAVISAYTDFYYYFDEYNVYHRGPGFLCCYIVPVLCPIIQYTIILKYRKSFSKFIYTALTLYIFLPILIGIIQIFTYGISIVNMAIVLTSVFLYYFTFLDVNAAVEKAYQIELAAMKNQQKNMKKIFGQAASAFAKLQGKSESVAQTAKELARRAGKDENECDKIYYAAFLCDAGADALSSIKEYPYLSETARYVGKPYDESIPEYARLITVAKDYDKMINDSSIPPFYLRDYLIRESGIKYDPVYAKLAVKILDTGSLTGKFGKVSRTMETELVCKEYRENSTAGIEVSAKVQEITFECAPLNSGEESSGYSLPSIILFDSSDGRVQTTAETIDSHKYLEYGEVWFDGHMISTSARNMELRNVAEGVDFYKIAVSRFDDHLLLKMQSPIKCFDAIVALPSASKSAYLGITGENVHLTKIRVETTERKTHANDIPRIAEKENYIDRIESDIPNVQIVSPFGDFTQPFEVKNNMKLFFHTQSLPEANLVWHCPCIILYSSDDKKVFGKNYHEYAVLKLDGEDNGSNDFVENNFIMKKTKNFTNWDEWESQNKTGYECKIELYRDGNEITVITQNKGIYIQNTSKIKDGNKEIYVTLSGDQVAITDIRVR